MRRQIEEDWMMLHTMLLGGYGELSAMTMRTIAAELVGRHKSDGLALYNVRRRHCD